MHRLIDIMDSTETAWICFHGFDVGESMVGVHTNPRQHIFNYVG